MGENIKDFEIWGIQVHSCGITDEDELANYVTRGRQLYGKSLKYIDVKADGEEVEITYHTEPIPFERIRRITGYLVGAMPRWNDAKKAEESDRVKHGLHGLED